MKLFYCLISVLIISSLLSARSYSDFVGYSLGTHGHTSRSKEDNAWKDKRGGNIFNQKDQNVEWAKSMGMNWQRVLIRTSYYFDENGNPAEGEWKILFDWLNKYKTRNLLWIIEKNKNFMDRVFSKPGFPGNWEKGVYNLLCKFAADSSTNQYGIEFIELENELNGMGSFYRNRKLEGDEHYLKKYSQLLIAFHNAIKRYNSDFPQKKRIGISPFATMWCEADYLRNFLRQTVKWGDNYALITNQERRFDFLSVHLYRESCFHDADFSTKWIHSNTRSYAPDEYHVCRSPGNFYYRLHHGTIIDDVKEMLLAVKQVEDDQGCKLEPLKVMITEIGWISPWYKDKEEFINSPKNFEVQPGSSRLFIPNYLQAMYLAKSIEMLYYERHPYDSSQFMVDRIFLFPFMDSHGTIWKSQGVASNTPWIGTQSFFAINRSPWHREDDPRHDKNFAPAPFKGPVHKNAFYTIANSGEITFDCSKGSFHKEGLSTGLYLGQSNADQRFTAILKTSGKPYRIFMTIECHRVVHFQEGKTDDFIDMEEPEIRNDRPVISVELFNEKKEIVLSEFCNKRKGLTFEIKGDSEIVMKSELGNLRGIGFDISISAIEEK
ncbi:MAG: hypothetical protein JXA60_08500 [Candidatus Coatesbacteria bacterium]|nr:hypothetical protein [Candidatus Coatesbacteria bacterium]